MLCGREQDAIAVTALGPLDERLEAAREIYVYLWILVRASHR